jgi:hypothetical protein
MYIMLFAIREVFFVDSNRGHVSLWKTAVDQLYTEERFLNCTEEDFMCRDFVDCKYCNAEKEKFLRKREDYFLQVEEQQLTKKQKQS